VTQSPPKPPTTPPSSPAEHDDAGERSASDTNATRVGEGGVSDENSTRAAEGSANDPRTTRAGRSAEDQAKKAAVTVLPKQSRPPLEPPRAAKSRQ